MRKPTMKSEWRGLKGNKWRVYIVTSPRGTQHSHVSKTEALAQYKAGLHVYKTIKRSGK